MTIRYPAVADLFLAVVRRACHQPAIDKEHKCNKDKKKYSKDGGQPVVAVHPVPLQLVEGEFGRTTPCLVFAPPNWPIRVKDVMVIDVQGWS